MAIPSINLKIPLIVILVLAVLLRLINLNQSFWLDEAAQAQMSSLSLSEIWSGRARDFHPPLFYFLAHAWLTAGASEVWLRLLPLTFGIINVYVIYLFATELFHNQKAAYLSAFFLSIAPFHIYYSQEFRSYSLLCLLGTTSMYLLIKQKYVWLALINALLLYTHYSSVFLIITQLLLRPQTISSGLLTLILYLPWLPHFFAQLQSGSNIGAALPGWTSVLSITPIKTLPVVLFKLIAGRINFLSRLVYGVYIFFVFAATFFALFVPNKHQRFLITWTFVPIFIMLVVSFLLPQSQPFRVIYVLPALILIFVQASLRFPKLVITLFVYIAVVGNVAYFTRPRLQREQWRQAAEFLSQQQVPVVVKFSNPFAPLFWYSPQLTVVPALPSLPALSYPKVFLMEYLTGVTDPLRTIDHELQSRGYHEAKVHNFEGVGSIFEYTSEQ